MRYFIASLLLMLSLIVSGTTHAQGLCDGLADINFGETVTGFIDNQQINAGYCFNASAGTSITIDLVATSGNLDTVLFLVDANGSTLDQNDDRLPDTNSQVVFTIPADGQYIIVATRFDGENGTTSGGFSLTLNQGVSATPLCDRAETIMLNNSYTGTLDDTNFADLYCFQASAGDTVRIEQLALSGNLDTLLSVRDTNTRVAFDENDDFNGTNSQIMFTAPESGTFAILATRFNGPVGNSSGDYMLVVELTASGGNAQPADSGTNGASDRGAIVTIETEDDGTLCGLYNGLIIANNETVSGTINNVTTEYVYCFDAEVGERISADMVSLQDSGNLAAYLTVQNAQTGETIAENGTDQASTVTTVSFDVPTTGRYILIATRFGAETGTTSGDFNLTFRRPLANEAIPRGPILPEQPATCNGLPSLGYGDGAVDSISNETSFVGYCFTATAGMRFRIDLVRTSGDLDPLLLIIDPNTQDVIANNDDRDSSSLNAQIAFTAPQTGYYLLVATRFELENGSTTGNYRLTVDLLGN